MIDAHLADSEAEESVEPEMNDEEFSEALLDVDVAVRIDQGEANGAEANKEISDDAITDMFKKTGVLPRAKGGQHITWSLKFIQLVVELLSNGETAASAYNFFCTQARFYPELLGAGKEVPNVKWFERCRDYLPYLNSMHTKDVILKAERLPIGQLFWTKKIWESIYGLPDFRSRRTLPGGSERARLFSFVQKTSSE